MDHIADSLGYFQSEQFSQVLNVPASIEATGRNGGIPAPVYYKRKQVRTVIILEDAFAEAREWNPTAQELAAGLMQRGVPVLHGQFRGSPQQFQMADGTVVQLEDLEDDRRGYLLLVFSDGKGLPHHQDTFALEALSRWPLVAWMELREPRLWDESTARVAHYGFPIYPATPDGLLQAMGRFLTERGAGGDVTLDVTDWRGLPAYRGTNQDALAVYLETLLGDALPWAQACAMIQPVSIGLADAVRQEFHPTLPPERIERLFALPNTTRNVSGLRFSDPVLAVLRRGFAIRWEEKDQQEILRFLLDKIHGAEPDQKDSLAHLAWEWERERVRLELEPDEALKRLSELSQTPLTNTMLAEMEHCVLPDKASNGIYDIPLRVKPQDKDALQRLVRLAPNSGVQKLEAYPVARGHWLALGVLGLSFVGAVAWGVKSYWDAATLPSVHMDFVLIPVGTFQMGESDNLHEVTISRPFYLGKYEVTQAQWEAVMGDNPSRFKGNPNRPVETVSWEDVQKFTRKLNEQEGGEYYRLPTEAEWEYAARAGSTTAYSFGDDPKPLRDYAWYAGNSDNQTHPVGQLKENKWGLHDMHGNVWEWVQDRYGQYPPGPVTDPTGPDSGSFRVDRGGSWNGDARYCRSAIRSFGHPGDRNNSLGFRLLRTAA